MEVHRVTCQKRSLIEFYTREAQRLRQTGNSRYPECLDAMVSLLKHLSASVDGPPVYAVTSLYKLCLISGDDYRLPVLVSIEAMGGDSYKVAYELPAAQAPWRDAWVVGYATDAPQAAEMILTGLKRNAHASQLDN